MFETTSQLNDFAISFFDQNIAKNHQGFHRDLPKMDRGSGFFDRWDDLIHSCHQISELFENQTALVRNRCTFFFAMAGVDWRYKLVQHHQHLVTYFASFSQQNRGHVMWKLFCLRCSVGFLTIFDLSWCYWAKQEQPRLIRVPTCQSYGYLVGNIFKTWKPTDELLAWCHVNSYNNCQFNIEPKLT